MLFRARVFARGGSVALPTREPFVKQNYGPSRERDFSEKSAAYADSA
jgi:hypothetical protein